MELRHVRTFLTLTEELHFGRAAARLHMAQPTLSDHVRQLERAVGAELVARGRSRPPATVNTALTVFDDEGTAVAVDGGRHETVATRA